MPVLVTNRDANDNYCTRGAAAHGLVLVLVRAMVRLQKVLGIGSQKHMHDVKLVRARMLTNGRLNPETNTIWHGR